MRLVRGCPAERAGYCPCPRPCRQAAYRARRRAEAAIRARVVLLQISQELQAHALALDELVAGALHAQQGLPGAHCIAAAGFQQRTRELVRCAVIADREAGATWATIGEALVLSADAARARYRKVRLLWPPPPQPT